jgi:phenolphthiocerol/phthiocerol/phthiodiolone dimycocerosyl transferase
MFTSSVIRKLSRSEEIFAETESFVGLGADVKGPIDADALSAAFDALLEAHPVLGGHLERGPDGRHQFAVDDLLHPGIEVVEIRPPEAPRCT